MKTMEAGEFKANCLVILDELARTGEPVLIAQRGEPVARVSPVEVAVHDRRPLFGRLRHMGTIRGDVVASDYADEE